MRSFRKDQISHLARRAGMTIEDMHAYVQATLGLQVWANGVDVAAKARPHIAAHEHAGLAVDD